MNIGQMILLGVGMAMDASAVSMTNGLVEAKMKKRKMLLIAFFFGFFQFAMPLIGYFTGSIFEDFLTKFTSWVALILLSFIGGKMLIEGIKNSKFKKKKKTVLSFKGLIVQSIATSIDALTIGLIFVGWKTSRAFLASSIIGVVTFILSYICIMIGKKFGDKLSNKAEIVGGIILILIGVKTFIEYLIEVL